MGSNPIGLSKCSNHMLTGKQLTYHMSIVDSSSTGCDGYKLMVDYLPSK